MAAANAVRSGTTGCARRRLASRIASESAPHRLLRRSREHPMRVFGASIIGAAEAIALLAGPARAQMQTPSMNLMPEVQSKSPEEKEQEAIKDKAYRESLKKIPDAKASNDPWGGVRSADAPKTAANPAPAKSRA